MPALPVSLASTLNAPGLTFSTNQWQAHRTTAASDGEAHAWVEPDQDTPAWLDAFVTGPALVSFASSARGQSIELHVGVSGSAVLTVFPEDKASISSVIVPQGYHTLRWQTYLNFTPGILPHFNLDQVKVTPLPPASVTQALDATNLTWRFQGFTPWSSASAPEAHDGSDFAYSPTVFANGSSVLETTVTGPGTLSFWWTSKTGYANASFTIPGTALRLDVPQSWKHGTIEIPAGNHALRWEIMGSAGAGAILLDQVSWVTSANPPLSEALNLAPTLLHLAKGAAVRDTLTNFDGDDSLRLEAGPGNYSASLTLWVQGPARIEAKILNPTGFLSPASLVQSSEWRPFVMELRPGLHPLTFSHRRSSTPLDQPSSSWIDSVTVTSIAIPLSDGLSAPDFEWRTNPDNPWSGMNSPTSSAPTIFTAPGPFAAIHPPSWLETTVNGPAVASFYLLGRYRVTLAGRAGFYGSANAFNPDGASLWIPPGIHTLRWQQDEATSNRSPTLSNFSLAPVAGDPSLIRSQNQFLLTVPRPAGFPDSRISIQQANYQQSPFFLNLNPQPPIVSSTPAAVIYRLTPPPNAGSSLFWRARFP